MGFVKTSQEVAAIQAVIAAPRFVNSEMLSVVARTDPAWLAEVIPAPLVPDGDTVRFMVGRWQSNCVGNFNGGAVYIPARFGDVAGEYVLAMYMDADAAIIYGREVFGEPKKQASVSLHRGPNHAVGVLTRGNVDIMRIEGVFDTDNGPSSTQGSNFNIKAMPDASGNGLQFDPILTVADFDVTWSVDRTGTGTVDLASTINDPLASIPVLEVLTAVWQEGDLIAQARTLATIPAADFLPYFFARVDDYSSLNTENQPTLAG
jgi:acetoacetate decarboxylase